MKKLFKLISAPVALTGAAAGVTVAATSCFANDPVKFAKTTFNLDVGSSGGTATAQVSDELTWGNFKSFTSVKALGDNAKYFDSITFAPNPDTATTLMVDVDLADALISSLPSTVTIDLKITVSDQAQSNADPVTATFTKTFTFNFNKHS
ncbi:MAG: hypothetical protein L3I91_00040 [Mycoplasma sp.]